MDIDERKLNWAKGLGATHTVTASSGDPVAQIQDLTGGFSRGGSLKSSWYGDCLPSRDFPYLIDLYRQGRFDLDAFVTETIALDDVEAAFTKMHHGDVLRSVVVL